MPRATVEFKNQILERCFVNGETVSSLAKETGYSLATIYKWRHDFIKNSLPIDIEKMNNGETRSSKDVQINNDQLAYFVISADGKRYNWDEIRKALCLYETLRRTYEQS